MTQEEKAKAYDEALSQARFYYGNCPTEPEKKKLEKLFPELRESEDERIMKRLITLIHILDSQFFTGDNPSKEQCLAYLENQKDILGERAQNITANMLEDGIEGVQRELIEFLSNTVNASWVDIIRSADSYAERIRNIIEKQKGSELLNNDEYHTVKVEILDRLYAHEKELEQLKKEQKPAECIEFDNEFKNQVSHLLASVLNKEWEYNKGFVEYAAQQLLGYAKHEIKPAEWSEEDIDKMVNARARKSGTTKSEMEFYRQGIKDTLKSLRPHLSDEEIKKIRKEEYTKGFNDAAFGGKLKEWSEEDEVAFNDLLWCIQQASKSAKDENDLGNIWFAENWVKNRLKSLRPQPHWKPSKEQMEALKWAIRCPSGINHEILATLYNDLKSL